MKLLTSLVLLKQAWGSDFPAFSAKLPAGIDAASIAPVFDFDSDGCLPAGGISPGGDINGGLNPTGSLGGACRSTNFLEQSNTYHRYTCKVVDGSEYCAHIYALYFEKDQLVAGVSSGHRHDWECAAVWTKDGVVTHGSASAHGDLSTRPAAEVGFENGHLKIVYHKEGAGSHAFRFASAEEGAENPYGRWVTPEIITWFEFSSEWDNFVLRTRLMDANYGSANLPIRDWKYSSLINDFRPEGYPSYSWGDLFNNNPLEFPSYVYDEYRNIVSTANFNICVDIAGERMENGNNVQLYTCGGEGAHHQRWYHQANTNQIRPLSDPRYCLDAVAPIQDFSNVQIYTCHQGYNQRWIREGDVLRVDTTPYILDANGGISEGNNLITFNNWGGSNQRWTTAVAKELAISAAPVASMLSNVAAVIAIIALIAN